MMTFNKTYNKDIIKDLQKYFSGKTSFDEFINGLFINPRECNCVSLHNAIKGITSHIRTVIEIIVTMASFMLKQILQKYPKIYKGKDLIKDIESCSSGIIKKILIGLIENNKGVNRWEGNNSFFCENFYDEFTNGVGVYIEIVQKRWYLYFERIDNKYSGDTKKRLSQFIFTVLSPSEFFVTKVNKGVKKMKKLL